jgi:hypothetical protein
VKPIEVPTRSTGLQPVLTDRRHGLKTRATKDKPREAKNPPANTVAIIVGGRVKYVPKPGAKSEPAKVAKPKRAKLACPERSRRVKARELLTFDPRFLKQNRELRDRYLERVNATPHALPSKGRYDVSRTLSAVEGSRVLASAPALAVVVVRPLPQLPAA